MHTASDAFQSHPQLICCAATLLWCLEGDRLCVRHVQQLCAGAGRPCPCVGPQQLWAARPARPGLPGLPAHKFMRFLPIFLDVLRTMQIPTQTAPSPDWLLLMCNVHCTAIESASCAVQEPIWAPALVKALEGKEVAAVRPGQHHTLFLAASGALLSAGRPTYGRLGRAGLDTVSDDAHPEPAPVVVPGAGRIAGVAAGLRTLHSLSGVYPPPECSTSLQRR